MRRFISNTNGSAYPVIVFILCLAIASFLVLLLGHVVEPFMNLMNSNDDSVDEDISAPRSLMATFIGYFWPKGLLLVIFTGLGMALFMSYQKKNYQEM